MNDSDTIMSEKTPKTTESTLDPNTELEALRKENKTLLDMISVAAKQREKYAAIEAENKELKNNWRMVYAGQAMSAIIASQPEFCDRKLIAYTSFMLADAMIKEST